MNRALNAVLLIILGIVLTACITPSPTAKVQATSGPNIGSARAESYHGSKAAIAVADFEDKTVGTGQYRPAYGRGMADMLVTSLFNTNRFIVLEREKLDAVIREQDMGATGRFRQDTAAAIGELEGAQLLVMAAVTGFEPGTAGTRASGRQRGGIFGDSRIAALAGGFRRSHLALDLRIVDTTTGRILAATNVEGSARSYNLEGSVIGTKASGALGTFARTPMEQAIRKTIDAAVEFVASQTPAEFYRH